MKWRPEIVGISIGYDYRAHSQLIKCLVEEHLIDVAARLQAFETTRDRAAASAVSDSGSAGSGSDSESEDSMLPASLSLQRASALELTGLTGANWLHKRCF